jgi:hypothetical protein
MLLHKNCGNHVVLNTQTAYSITGAPSITMRGIKATELTITKIPQTKKGKGTEPVQFICRACGTSPIPDNELVGYCTGCGTSFSTNAIYKLPSISVILCEDCMKKHAPELEKNKISLATLIAAGIQ